MRRVFFCAYVYVSLPLKESHGYAAVRSKQFPPFEPIVPGLKHNTRGFFFSSSFSLSFHVRELVYTFSRANIDSHSSFSFVYFPFLSLLF